MRAKRDAKDRRKSFISVTAAGRQRVESIRASRDTWLMHAIEATVGPEERPRLEQTIDLLERLADAHLGPQVGIR